MQVDSPDLIRNLAVVGHNDAGKTTLISALLYAGGAANRFNAVEDGNTVTDFDEEEIERGISIGLAACFTGWKGNKINLLDAPGYGVFFTETRAAMRAADAAVLCLDAVSGVEVVSERAWAYAKELDMPVLIFLSKMDRERADLAAAMETLTKRLGREAVAVQIPIGKEDGFEGVIDLIEQKAYRYSRDGNGKSSGEAVPEDLEAQVEEYRNNLVEAVAENDDQLMETYFEEGTLSDADLRTGLRQAILDRQLFPVAMGTPVHGIGTSALLDTIVALMPSPADRDTFPAKTVGGEDTEVAAGPEEPMSALVFKTLSDPFSGKISLFRVVSGTLESDSQAWNTQKEEAGRVGHLLSMQGKHGTQVQRVIAGDIGGVAKLKTTASGDTLCDKNRPIGLGWIKVTEPAISFAIEPKAKGDDEKIGEALARLMDEDPTLRAGREPQTGEYLLSGSGEMHVNIAVAKLKKRFNVEVILHPPKVPYRETIRRTADGHGRHKKQSGGRGQFADCRIKLEPMPRGEEFEFVDEIFGGSIPQGYRPAVNKGIEEARARGYLAGFPVVDFRVRLLDGQHHDVDSSEMAFKIAGSLAFKDAMANAAPTILEPMMLVEITTAEEYTGDVISDLSQRRGRPQGMEGQNGSQLVKAIVPMSEMLDYAPSLRSMTQGRASFHMEYSHYDEVPRPIQLKIIQASKSGGE